MLKRLHFKESLLLIIFITAMIIYFFIIHKDEEFQIKNGVLLMYRGTQEHVIVPEGVEEIGRLAFQDCDTILTVEIPEGVEIIGDGAFANCSNLQTVTIPESVETIGEQAFAYDFELQYVNLPEGLEVLSTEMFYGCHSLQEIELGDNIKQIGDYSFYQCSSLEEVIIPESTASIGNSAFSGCENLEKIQLPEYDLDVGTNVFANCTSLQVITLPGRLKYINNGMFWGCTSLKSIVLPETVASIGDHAFYKCESLTSCDFPDKMSNIGNEAFYGCSGLQTIQFSATRYLPNAPEGATNERRYAVNCTIGTDTFAECSSLNHVEIPAHVTICSNSFFGCESLDNLSVDPEHLQYVVIDSVLYSSSLQELILYPAGLSQTEFYIPDQVKSIAERAFSANQNLNIVHAGMELSEVGVGAFFRCDGLREVYWNEGIETIHSDAFRDCKSMTRFEIPADCDLDISALRDCPSLSEIVVDSRNRSFYSEEGVLFDYSRRRLLLYPAKKAENYYTVPDTVDTIAEYAFTGSTHLETLLLPESVKTIERRAFAECGALQSVTMSDSVEAMATEIFYGIEDTVSLTVYADSEKCIPLIYAENVGIQYKWFEKED